MQLYEFCAQRSLRGRPIAGAYSTAGEAACMEGQLDCKSIPRSPLDQAFYMATFNNTIGQ